MKRGSALWFLAALLAGTGATAAFWPPPLRAACDQARQAASAAGQERALLLDDATILREELERLGVFRKDIRAATEILEDAGVLKDGGDGLSPAQVMTLNSRLPIGLAAFNAEGRVFLAAEKSTPLAIDEALQKLRGLALRAAGDSRAGEVALQKKEQEIARLSRSVESLEARVATQCLHSGPSEQNPAPVNSAPSGEIYRRYVEREQLRLDEVGNRAYRDLERLYVRSYEAYQRRHGGLPRPAARSQAVLVGLYGESQGHVGRYCIPFGSEAEKSWILDEYHRAARSRERIPGLGRLQEVKVLEAFEDVSLCHSKLR